MTPTELRKAVDGWLAGDPDAGTRAELEALVREGNTAEVQERFANPVGFGTAGLRALMGAGPSRMNRAVVRSATAGLARWLLRTAPDAVKRGVVVARDARRMSAEFAADTAAVLAGAGIPAWVFPEGTTPTPVGAFAVTALGAAAGVVVTASHNPKDYNGYKVYGPNGAQVIPPDDAAIAAEMDKVGPANAVPLLAADAARARGLLRDAGPEVRERYLEAILKERRHPGKGTDLVIAYTAMHGVGGALALEALRRAGFERLHPVLAQQEPDGAFPTVAFPNPEEPGALDLARALAETVRADVVLANDPDADRLAVLVRGKDGSLRQLSGNEVGVLLAHYLLTEGPKSRPLVMTSVVSSPELRQIAARLGASYEETLTGFKWIANRAIQREREGEHFILGYEEALGYAVGPAVHDKDGMGAAVVVADLAGWARSRGATVEDALDDLARQYGVYGSLQRSVALPGASGVATMARVMEAFRKETPSAIAGRSVAAVRDYATGRRTASGASSRLDFPKADLLAFELDGGAQVLLRPSGTEPKLKLYVEVSETPDTHEAPEVVRARVSATAALLADGVLEEARKRGLPQS